MDEGTPPRLLLEGRPGIGKSTLARRLLALLQQADVPVGGFITAELRTNRCAQAPAGHPGGSGHQRDPRRPPRAAHGVPARRPARAGPVSVVSTPSLEEAARAKQAVRERVWALLERERVARFPGAKGRIPNFAGAPAATARLASLPAWRAARVLKANPDAPQLPVRARALGDGKLVYMAVPRLADERPFILLDPARLDVPPRRAASIAGSTRAGRRVGVAELQPVDLVVCGSVAVNHQGARVGKGGGFSDLEFALLVEAGLIGEDTVLTTTVHPLQVLDEALPETPHDFGLDVIVAGEEVITCRRSRRPPGILWEHLDAAKIAAIPALAERRGTGRP